MSRAAHRQPHPPASKYIGVDEMAEALGISENGVRRRIDSGRIPAANCAFPRAKGEHRRVLRAVFVGLLALKDKPHAIGPVRRRGRG